MRILNIGAGPKAIPMPPYYRDCEVIRLDCEPENEPDLLMDAMDLDTMEGGQFDAAYASHLLEHIYPAVLARFLAGVRHVLKEDGYFEVRVPDGLAACRQAVTNGSLDALCYKSPAGPITAWDILYGYLPFQVRFGTPMAHHSAYDALTLRQILEAYGFPTTHIDVGHFELRAIACKRALTRDIIERVGIDNETGKRGAVHSNAGASNVVPIRQFRNMAGASLRQGRRAGADYQTAETAAGRCSENLPSSKSLGRGS